jgi:LAO/AO transport system kinase
LSKPATDRLVKPFYVYMLRCGDGSYYTGHTDDVGARMQQHFAGEIGYTSTRQPVELVWQGEFESREGALGFEQQIKGWPRAKKEALMAGDWNRVQELVRSRSDPVRPEPVEGQSPPRLPQTHPEPGLLQRILGSDPSAQRRAIAKSITLLESTRGDHRAHADELLTALLPHTGKAFRLGISGVPGVGKSTFIETLGLALIAQGHRVAVLAIDPSSSVSGGSILGDKTRMEQLSVHPQAYIRPSPASGTLGGVAAKTRESMLVCEAAGYDIVIVETVGVGQSETAVAGMTDMFVLMQLPNAGDDLQAIKKGVMELADLVVINKADIDRDAATRAQAQITGALRILGQHGHPEHAHHDTTLWHPQVLQLSALKGEGVDGFWQAVTRFRELQHKSGRLEARRRQQSLAWMWERIESGLKQAFRHDPQVKALLPKLAKEVEQGRLAASTAARQLLSLCHPGLEPGSRTARKDMDAGSSPA